MPDLSYSRVKIREATEILATSTGNVKERLLLAVSRRLVFVDVEVLPKDLQPLLRSIRERLTKKDPQYRGQSRIEATLYRMHNITAAKIARDLWRLNLYLTERSMRPDWPQTRLTPRWSGTRARAASASHRKR